MASTSICSVVGCEKPRRTRGMCIFHWRRFNRGTDMYAPSAHFSRGQPTVFMRNLVGTNTQECIAWPFAKNGKHGRGVIKLDGRMQLVHRVLCAMVNGEPPTPHHEAAHLCGKGHLACVNPNHLAWKTHVDNMADTLVHGTRRRGAKAASAKLTDEQVLSIRRLVARGMTQSETAEIFGVEQPEISRIVNRKRWRHI